MATLTTILAQMGQGYGNHMDGWDNGPSWWMVVPMVVLGVALLAVFVWGILAVTRAGQPRQSGPPAGPSPLDILSERYARGEIETADYEERKRALS